MNREDILPQLVQAGWNPYPLEKHRREDVRFYGASKREGSCELRAYWSENDRWRSIRPDRNSANMDGIICSEISFVVFSGRASVVCKVPIDKIEKISDVLGIIEPMRRDVSRMNRMACSVDVPVAVKNPDKVDDKNVEPAKAQNDKKKKKTKNSTNN